MKESIQLTTTDLICYCTSSLLLGAAIALSFCWYIELAGILGTISLSFIMGHALNRGHIPAGRRAKNTHA